MHFSHEAIQALYIANSNAIEFIKRFVSPKIVLFSWYHTATSSLHYDDKTSMRFGMSTGPGTP